MLSIIITRNVYDKLLSLNQKSNHFKTLVIVLITITKVFNNASTINTKIDCIFKKELNL